MLTNAAGVVESTSQAGDRGRDGFRTRNTGLKETACVEQSDGKKSREGYSRREGYGIPRSVI